MWSLWKHTLDHTSKQILSHEVNGSVTNTVVCAVGKKMGEGAGGQNRNETAAYCVSHTLSQGVSYPLCNSLVVCSRLSAYNQMSQERRNYLSQPLFSSSVFAQFLHFTLQAFHNTEGCVQAQEWQESWRQKSQRI